MAICRWLSWCDSLVIYGMPRTKKFFAVLVLYIAVFILWGRVGKTFPEWLSVVVCAWLFLVGPVALFMTASLARDEIHFEDPRGFIGIVLRVLVGTPLGCFGIVCLVTGLAVIAFAAWSAWVKADYDMLKNVPGLLVFAAMSAFGWFVLRRALVGEGQTRKEIEKLKHARLAALLHPDWAFYAEHLGRPIPEALKKIYADPRQVQASPDLRGMKSEEESIEFEPLHRDYCVPAEESDLPYDIVPVATADDQNWIFLKPGKDETNQVLMADPEEPENIVILADSVETFLALLIWENESESDS